MNYEQITQRHIAEAYRELDRVGNLIEFARRHNVSLNYLKNKLQAHSVRDSYLADPFTPLSACGGLSLEARL